MRTNRRTSGRISGRTSGRANPLVSMLTAAAICAAGIIGPGTAVAQTDRALQEKQMAETVDTT